MTRIFTGKHDAFVHRGRARWKLLALLLLPLFSLCAALDTQAADYPRKPVSIVCAFGAGTGADLILRPTIPYIKEALGTEIVPEYKAGSAGIVGANYFATKRPDGYTLLFYNQPHILLQDKFMKTSVKTDDLIPLLGLTHRPDFLIVRADDPRFKDIQALIAYAKENPGKLTVGTVGKYSGNHLTYLLLKKNTDLEMTRVPFENGGKMLAALLGGQVDCVLSSHMWLDQYEGKLKAIASATEERLDPDVPTFVEVGIPNVFGSTNSNYIFASKKTPPEVLAYLREKFSALAQNKQLQEEYLKAMGKYDYAIHDEAKCMEEIEKYRKQIDSVDALLREDEKTK